MNFIFWKPLKRVGGLLDFLNLKTLYFLFIPIYVLGILIYQFQDAIPQQIKGYFPVLFAFVGMIMVFKSFSERKSPFMAWVLIIMNHFWIALSIFFNEKVAFNEIFLYLSGIVIAGLVGYFSLFKLMKEEKGISMNQYSGHSYEHPRFALLFLIAALGVTGFPITTTFIGEDLLYSHIHSNQIVLAVFVSQSFIIGGIAAIRIYARIYLGPHCKSYHELPYKSS